MTSHIRSLVVGVAVALSALGANAVSAQGVAAQGVGGGVEGDVDVAPIVVTASGPSGVVPGNTVQTITVTVRNDLPRPIPTARVELDGVDNSGPQTVAVPAFTSLTVTFDVVACRSGTSTVTATVNAVVDSTSLAATGDSVTLRVASGSTCTTTVSTPGGTLSMTTTAGRVSGLTAIALAGLPTPPAGLNLPYGAISFTIEDLDPGASVTVRITVPGPATSYAKLTASGWVLVPGAVTIGNGVAVTLVDGGIGDADGLANGRIVDPGAVVAPTQVPPPADTPPTTTPATTVAPAAATNGPSAAPPIAAPSPPIPASPAADSPPARATPTTPTPTPTGGLPQTGGDARRLVVAAVVLLALGGALVVMVRQGRLTRPSPARGSRNAANDQAGMDS